MFSAGQKALWRDRVERNEHVLEDLLSRVNTLERQIDRSEAQAEVYKNELAVLTSTHQNAIRAFELVAEQYTDGLVRARTTITELTEQSNELSRPFRNTPLHKTEEEEDLEFQLDHNVISMTEYNDALRAAGLADN